MSVYSYSLSGDFGGEEKLTTESLAEEVEAETGITATFGRIDLNGDDLEIWFESALSGGEITLLNAVVAAHEPRIYNDTLIFDTIVDSKYAGDYLTISEAFAAGKTSVYVRDGFYKESTINMPDKGRIIGESKGNVVIDFSISGGTLTVNGNGGSKETTGTISVANGSATVVGVGTTFTNLSAADHILMRTKYYEILSIESNTSLTLKDIYQGNALSAIAYVAQTMFENITIENCIIQGSSNAGVSITGVRQSEFINVTVKECAPNIEVSDSGVVVMNNIVSTNSTGDGISITDCYGLKLANSSVYNSTGSGVKIGGNSTDVNVSGVQVMSNASTGILITDNASQTQITASTVTGNVGVGVQSSANTSGSSVSGSTVGDNAATGIILGGANDIVTSTAINSNGGGGIQVDGDGANISNNMTNNNTTDGITVNSAGTTVSSNGSSGNGGDGIAIGTGAQDTVVAGNNPSGNTGDDVKDEGTVVNLPPFTTNELDAQTAGTFKLAFDVATKVEIADTLVTTEIQGPLDAKEGFVLTGQLTTDNGSKTVPPYTFSNDTNTGIYRESNGDLAFAQNGTSTLKVTTSNRVIMSSDVPDYETLVDADNVFPNKKYVDDKTWAANDVVSGTFADARIAESSITQHEAAVTIGNLINAPSGVVVGTTDIQTLTNKTITASTNNVAAKSLHSATTIVDVASASAPTVDQVLTATGSTTATWQTPSVFGDEYQIAESAGVSSTSNSSYQEKLSMTTGTLPAGDYRVSWCYNWRHSDTKHDFMARVQVDNTTTIHEHQQEPKDRSDSQSFLISGFAKVTLSNAQHTIDVDYTRDGGTAYIWNTRLEIFRIS
jgi:hypothetical protein